MVEITAFISIHGGDLFLFSLLSVLVISAMVLRIKPNETTPKEFKTSRFRPHSKLSLYSWKFRSNCDCGAYFKSTGRHAEVLIYTRQGTFKSMHTEYRSSFWFRSKIDANLSFRCCSKKCIDEYFYGFETVRRKLFYDDNCLECPYFFTSEKLGNFKL